MICVIIIGAQISIPLPGMVPISLQTMAIYILAMLFEKKQAFMIALIYVVMGAIGLPVFSGMSGGASHLLGPAGGFIFSFPVMAYIISALCHSSENYVRYFLAMIVGTLVCYLIGTAYFMGSTKAPLITALMSCVIPFIPGDLIKMITCTLITSRLKVINFAKKTEI